MASWDRQCWRAKSQKSKGQFYAGPIFPAGPPPHAFQATNYTAIEHLVPFSFHSVKEK